MNKKEFIEWCENNSYINSIQLNINFEQFNNICINEYKEIAEESIMGEKLNAFEYSVLTEAYFKSFTSFGTISELILDLIYIENFDILLYGSYQEIEFEINELNNKISNYFDKIKYYLSDNLELEYD